MRLISIDVISENSLEFNPDIRRIVGLVLQYSASSVVIARKSSSEHLADLDKDCRIAVKYSETFALIETSLIDYIIIDKSGAHSLRSDIPCNVFLK